MTGGGATSHRAPYSSAEWRRICTELRAERERRGDGPFTAGDQQVVVNRVLRELRQGGV
ncbi:MAG TPA: hypothetical protein VGG07_14240 [Solirubrobacteraceae bacterium]|jgi:hypothetical protein